MHLLNHNNSKGLIHPDQLIRAINLETILIRFVSLLAIAVIIVMLISNASKIKVCQHPSAKRKKITISETRS